MFRLLLPWLAPTWAFSTPLLGCYRVERSSDQVIKPVNVDALTKWVGQMPKDVVADMADIAPMLAKLGYDPAANPPNYGSPDAFVADNTRRIRDQPSLWDTKAHDLNMPLAGVDEMETPATTTGA